MIGVDRLDSPKLQANLSRSGPTRDTFPGIDRVMRLLPDAVGIPVLTGNRVEGEVRLEFTERLLVAIPAAMKRHRAPRESDLFVATTEDS